MASYLLALGLTFFFPLLSERFSVCLLFVYLETMFGSHRSWLAFCLCPHKSYFLFTSTHILLFVYATHILLFVYVHTYPTVRLRPHISYCSFTSTCIVSFAFVNTYRNFSFCPHIQYFLRTYTHIVLSVNINTSHTFCVLKYILYILLSFTQIIFLKVRSAHIALLI